MLCPLRPFLVAHGLSCSTAHGIVVPQPGMEPVSLAKADSQPVDHQEGPPCFSTLKSTVCFLLSCRTGRICYKPQPGNPSVYVSILLTWSRSANLFEVEAPGNQTTHFVRILSFSSQDAPEVIQILHVCRQARQVEACLKSQSCHVAELGFEPKLLTSEHMLLTTELHLPFPLRQNISASMQSILWAI